MNQGILPTAASFLVTEDCNLRCTYCLTGDTLITMSDYSKKPIKDIKIGDEVLGFDEYVERNKQRKIKPAIVEQVHHRKSSIIKVVFDDNQSISITANHKILNNRGKSKYSWKEAGKYKIGDRLMMMPNIKITQPDVDDINYKLGYFIAMMLGDGHIGKYKDKNNYDVFRVRIAVKDIEIIDKMEEYFNFFNIDYQKMDFLISKKNNITTKCIYSNKKKTFEIVKSLIDKNFKKNNTIEYYQGFLAGIYDAEGSINKKNVIRICNSDQDILNEIIVGLKLLNIDYVKEKNKHIVNHQTYNIRILSKIKNLDSLKFILSTNPVVKRKGVSNFYHKAYLSTSKIISINDLKDEVDVYNIGTSTRTYIANNVAVHNCFEKHKQNHMSKEVARQGLEYLCENALKNGDDHFSAMLFGGEPLMNVDIVEEILEYGVALGKKKGIFFSASMVTNATIMNERIKNLFIKYKDLADLSVQLSVDGIKEIHDRYRITVGGKGSFDAIEKNVPVWKEIFSDNLNRLNVHGCSNHDTLAFLFENYKFFREVWQIPRIWFLPIHSEKWTEEDVGVYEEQLGKIADYILDIVKRDRKMDEVLYYAPIDRCLSHDSFPGAPCGAGKNFVTITADGEIYPCHQVYFNDPKKLTKIGDIWNGIDEMRRKFFLSYDNGDLDCKKLNPDCDAYACYRCIAENYLQNGSFLAQTDCLGNRCKMSQVERKIQLKMRKELEEMGLLNTNENTMKGNNPNNPDCLCDCRGGSMSATEEEESACHCRGGCSDEGSEAENTIALAIKTILDRLDTIEKGQEYLLKKILK